MEKTDKKKSDSRLEEQQAAERLRLSKQTLGLWRRLA